MVIGMMPGLIQRGWFDSLEPLNINDELREIAISLKQGGVDYALCDGLAVALYGYPRATQDIDLLVEEPDLNRAVKVPENIGYTLSDGYIPFGPGENAQARIYRISKAHGEELLAVDLVLASSVFNSIWVDRKTIPVEDYELSVVSLEGLIKMKQLAGRPQERVDLHRLEEEE
jgi:hypothetical protein